MDLYYHPLSPPCWSVLMLSRELDLKFNLQQVSFAPDYPQRDAFVKLNPQHQVPTLADGEFGLGESRVILRYLMVAHSGSEDHQLYPKDAKIRSTIEARLDFDLGMFYRRAYDYFSPQWKSQSAGSEEDRKKVCEALGFLEEFLGRNRYVAGDQLTIADFSLVGSVSFLDVCGFDLKEYPKVAAWYAGCKKEIKGYQEMVGDQFETFRNVLLKRKQ